jgi:cold shock CspA family protein
VAVVTSAEVVCRDCQHAFRVSVEFFEARGLALPARCPACRRARRLALEEGTVAYLAARGFGFIEPDAGGERLFFDLHDFGDDRPALQVGTRVEFMRAPGTPNQRARRVRVLEASPR